MKHISNPNDVTFRDLLLIIRLFEGETLQLKALAQEFGVSVRTLQRDFAQRLAPVLGGRLQKCPEGSVS
ncbi:MAG: HTH domain-containing protein [Campylobacterales bacterium]